MVTFSPHPGHVDAGANLFRAFSETFSPIGKISISPIPLKTF